MLLSSSLAARANSLAPDSFRRWTIGSIGFAVAGYAAFTVLDVQSSGIGILPWNRHFLFSLVLVGALMLAMRWNPVLGASVALVATWVEVHAFFFTAPVYPTAGVLVLPVLVLATGLMFGSRTCLAMALVSVATAYAGYRISTPVVLGNGVDVPYWFLTHLTAMLAVWALTSLGLTEFARVFDVMVAGRQALADTIDFAPHAIIVIDEHERIQLVNPAAERLLLQPSAALVGSSLPAVMQALLRDPSSWVAMQKACGQQTADVRLTFSGEQPCHVEASCRQMNDGRRQVLMRDVTRRVIAEEQQQAMEAQLAHAQRLDAVGRLAGGLAHDFNNILTAVSGSAELLRRVRTDAERAELIGEIIDAKDRGTLLTRQLLSFARRDVRQPQILDVAVAIRAMERLLTRVAGEQVRLVFQLLPGCRIAADPGQLEHALVNLVANARDAMPSGGTCTISVRTERQGDGVPQVVLSVCDTGTGMPSSVAARAFEPFFTTKARGRGTGLGLASVHAMATQCNGTARIDSTPDHGTSVTLELPAVSADASTPPPKASPVPLSAGAHHILVAEDDSGTRRIVERLLTAAGFTVSLCANGTEAINIIESTSVTIDLVLSDIMMPGHTGPQVAARVAEVRPGTPVLLMSGYAEDYLGDVLTSGVPHEVITKPFSGATLTACIASIIQAAQTART